MHRMLTCKPVLVFLICVRFFAAQGQPQNIFRHLGVQDGLYQKNVTDVLQDKNGFIWIAAGRALQRYDGQQFLNFFPLDDKNGRPTGEIKSMLPDNDQQRIWLLTFDNRLGVFDIASKKFSEAEIVLPAGATSYQESRFFKDEAGRILIVFNQAGIITYDPSSNKADTAANPFTFPKGWSTINLYQDKDGCYWICCKEGLAKYNPRTKTLSTGAVNRENDPIIKAFSGLTNILNVFADQEGRFWMNAWPAAGDKLLYYDLSARKVVDCGFLLANIVKTYSQITSIRKTPDQLLWFSGKKILVSYSAASGYSNFPSVAERPGNIEFDEIFRLYADREKNTWLATDKGLYRFNPSSQTIKNSIVTSDKYKAPHNIVEIAGICEASNGTVLVSSWGGGIFSYDSSLRPYQSRFTTQQLQSNEMLSWGIVQRRNGQVWWGHQFGWLSVYDNKTNRRSTFFVKNTDSSTIRQIAEDKKGTMWLGLQSGRLLRFDSSTGKFEIIRELKSHILTLTVDVEGWLWAGTETEGLYQINTSSGSIVRHFTKNERELVSNAIQDLQDYNDSTLAGAAGGLFLLNKFTGTIRYLNYSSGISTVLKDNKGFLWTAAGDGIQALHPTLQPLPVVYDERDGLRQLTFNPGVKLLTTSNKIVFGTSTGFVHFDPDSARVARTTGGQLQVSAFSVNDQSLSVDSLLALPYISLPAGHNSLQIRFTSNTFRTSYRVAFLLSGIENDWTELEQGNQLNLHFLPPGTYLLEAGVLHNERNVSSIISLRITVQPPFYRTWVFYLLVLLGIATILYWIDSERQKRKQDVWQMRAGIAEKLHDDVNTTLEKISLLAGIADYKSKHDPRKTTEFLEQIKTRSSSMLSVMQDMLWAITPENDNMQNVAGRLQQYAQQLEQQKERTIAFAADHSLHQVRMNMQRRYNTLVLMKSLLNLLVSEGADQINISLSVHRQQLLYALSFSTAACDEQALQHSLNHNEITERLHSEKAIIQFSSQNTTARVECRIKM